MSSPGHRRIGSAASHQSSHRPNLECLVALLQEGVVSRPEGNRSHEPTAPAVALEDSLMDVPLSFTTAPHGPYYDANGRDGLGRYRYRGTDPGHRDNVGLRFAHQELLPLVYFHGLVSGKYVATWPVIIVADLR